MTIPQPRSGRRSAEPPVLTGVEPAVRTAVQPPALTGVEAGTAIETVPGFGTRRGAAS